MITVTKGKYLYLGSRNLDTAEFEKIMLVDVENFMKSIELNLKVCNQKTYISEETGREITYKSKLKDKFLCFHLRCDTINFTIKNLRRLEMIKRISYSVQF